jgi:hypothetical protein
VGFSKINSLIFQLGGSEHNKLGVAVGFQLWTLMGAKRVLNGELMQAKFMLELSQHFFSGFVQANPDKAVGLFQDFTDVVQFNISNLASFMVGCTIYY